VNGSVRPQIEIAPGERQFWRIVNASADRYVDLQLEVKCLKSWPWMASPSHVTIPIIERVSPVMYCCHRRQARSHCYCPSLARLSA